MTTEIKRGQTAEQATGEKKTNILKMLREISTYMVKYEVDGVNWGDVGSLGFAEEQLTHIMEHFGIEKRS